MRAGWVLYCLWAALAVGLSIAIDGLSAASVTRLLVIGFLALQVSMRARLIRALPGLPPRVRFVVMGTALAAVVEGFHMISMPVFLSLRIGWETPWIRAAQFYAIDLLFTVPAYLLIFSLIWLFINRCTYSVGSYAIIMGIGQTLGDGGLFFFLAAPAMLFFLPYPMTNYHAINVLPFLAVRTETSPPKAAPLASWLAIPALISCYLFCGTLIKLLGRAVGLEPN